MPLAPFLSIRAFASSSPSGCVRLCSSRTVPDTKRCFPPPYLHLHQASECLVQSTEHFVFLKTPPFFFTPFVFFPTWPRPCRLVRRSCFPRYRLLTASTSPPRAGVKKFNVTCRSPFSCPRGPPLTRPFLSAVAFPLFFVHRDRTLFFRPMPLLSFLFFPSGSGRRFLEARSPPYPSPRCPVFSVLFPCEIPVLDGVPTPNRLPLLVPPDNTMLARPARSLSR